MILLSKALCKFFLDDNDNINNNSQLLLVTMRSSQKENLRRDLRNLTSKTLRKEFKKILLKFWHWKRETSEEAESAATCTRSLYESRLRTSLPDNLWVSTIVFRLAMWSMCLFMSVANTCPAQPHRYTQCCPLRSTRYAHHTT